MVSAVNRHVTTVARKVKSSYNNKTERDRRKSITRVSCFPENRNRQKFGDKCPSERANVRSSISIVCWNNCYSALWFNAEWRITRDDLFGFLPSVTSTLDYWDRCSVCLSVCVSVKRVSCAQTVDLCQLVHQGPGSAGKWSQRYSQRFSNFFTASLPSPKCTCPVLLLLLCQTS